MKKIFLCCLTIAFFELMQTQVHAQWNQISIPTTEDLFMVRFASETTGWVVGKNFVYKTSDGGSS